MHHHSTGFMVALFGMFFAGVTIATWRVAARTVNSVLNGISTYKQYLQHEGPVQLTKIFVAFVFLVYWLYHQTDLEILVAFFWPTSLGAVPQWLQGFLVLNPAMAGFFGIGFDVFEDLVLVAVKKRFPQFFQEVPPTLQSAITKEIASTSIKP